MGATAGPVSADAHVRIGNVTKAFTSTVVLQLVAGVLPAPDGAGDDLPYTKALVDAAPADRQPDRRSGPARGNIRTGARQPERPKRSHGLSEAGSNTKANSA
ncbi:hypothetical protein ABZ622_28980 [Streptomyces sp. NPDC007164]|uniref:hypothetical protein n=1 Tax=Streptomyces sp. NPDC007164 TaxID=3156918 RepID=UPI0033DD0517